MKDTTPTVFLGEAEYEQFMRVCWSQALFGHPNPFDHPVFKALRRGFQLSLDSSGYTCSVAEVSPIPNGTNTILLELQLLRKAGYNLNFHQKILFMYNLIPDDVNKVLPKVKCRAYVDNKVVFLYAAVLELRIRQYLLGVGHPKGLKDVYGLTEEKMEKARKDPAFRWKLLMVASTGSPQMPPNATWELKVS